MSATLPLAPAESLATILRYLLRAVVARTVGGRTTPLVLLLIGRFRAAREGFERLAARLAAGTYRPRRSSPGRKPAAAKPRQKSEIRQNFGWLLPLAPEAAAYRGQFQTLLATPDMVALMAAAPAPMARILRPLCWMFCLKPPPILARPRRAAGPTPAPAATAPAATALPAAAQPAPPVPPVSPASPAARACGPPHPA